ncbi:MAG TPA: AAA domain-containing protein, partial [Kofleriaceae bacterium]|nr:AAA domain-containing protein [Kofleriaceae bacterium]
ARFRPRGITASQRAAAERFLGSTLSAVQGPPGTGKTELILNLAANAVVERIGGAVRSAPMRSGLLVVASTNNRAVDNVIDPLGRDFPAERLPLALRIGNQEVIATRTARELERARDWMAGQDAAGAAERLSEALAGFQAARVSFDAVAGPEIARAERRTRLAEIRRELATLGPAPIVAPDEVELRRALVQLRAELVQLQRVARARGRRQLRKLGEGWTRIARGQLAALAGMRAVLSTALSVALPPEVDDAWNARDKLDAWDEGIEDALELVDAAMPGGRESEARQRTSLAEELAALEAEPEPGLPDPAAAGEIESLGHALFVSSLEVRERWAVASRDELLGPLDAAIRAAVQQRSLRRQLSRQGAARSPLRALYPVMGCTLLSLGGSFELEADTIDALVIDEAGQCHPAHAVGGLARARRALLIGDVHQLPPVVNLSERDEARVRRDAAVRIPAGRFAPFRVHESGDSSAQALADRAVVERPTLTDHFRCQPPIIGLCDELCGYGLAVHTLPRSFADRAPSLRAPLLFAGVDGEQVRVRGSWSNQAEADRLIALLVELGAAGIDWSDIGVMAPYVGQIELLRGRLRSHRIPFEAASEDFATAAGGEAGGLSIGTVHRFQGGERPVVLFSTVVTEPRSLPFLDDRVNLLNVAVSRARDHLVTFGCARALRAGARTRLLVERAAPL